MVFAVDFFSLVTKESTALTTLTNAASDLASTAELASMAKTHTRAIVLRDTQVSSVLRN